MPIPSTRDRIIWRLHLRSSPQQVFDLLSTSKGRASFWAESAEEEEAHGVIHFRFINGIETRSRIIERTAPSRFVIDYFGSRVAFDLEPAASGGTDLTMTNTGFDQADYDELLPGWLNVLFPLKAAADFGIDLRNHDPKRTWYRGFVDQ